MTYWHISWLYRANYLPFLFLYLKKKCILKTLIPILEPQMVAPHCALTQFCPIWQDHFWSESWGIQPGAGVYSGSLCFYPWCTRSSCGNSVLMTLSHLACCPTSPHHHFHTHRVLSMHQTLFSCILHLLTLSILQYLSEWKPLLPPCYK